MGLNRSAFPAILPFCINNNRSVMDTSLSRRCSITIIDIFCFRKCTSVSSTSAVQKGSRLAVGSSRMSKAGFMASTEAIATLVSHPGKGMHLPIHQFQSSHGPQGIIDAFFNLLCRHTQVFRSEGDLIPYGKCTELGFGSCCTRPTIPERPPAG